MHRLNLLHYPLPPSKPPTLPRAAKIPLKNLTSCSAWGVYLQRTPINYSHFFRLGVVHVHPVQCTPLATPMHKQMRPSALCQARYLQSSIEWTCTIHVHVHECPPHCCRRPHVGYLFIYLKLEHIESLCPPLKAEAKLVRRNPPSTNGTFGTVYMTKGHAITTQFLVYQNVDRLHNALTH